jgi:hypothetical protein
LIRLLDLNRYKFNRPAAGLQAFLWPYGNPGDSACFLLNVTNFSRNARKLTQRHGGTQRYFLQDACPANGSRQARDCGKIIKKLLNHLAIIILRFIKKYVKTLAFSFGISDIKPEMSKGQIGETFSEMMRLNATARSSVKNNECAKNKIGDAPKRETPSGDICQWRPEGL